MAWTLASLRTSRFGTSATTTTTLPTSSASRCADPPQTAENSEKKLPRLLSRSLALHCIEQWTPFLCIFFFFERLHISHETLWLCLQAAGGATGFPMTLSCLQLGVGVIYALFLWAAPDARNKPKVSFSDIKKMLPVGVCMAGAHAGSVFALGAGAVSFAQIVKSAEPAFAAVVMSNIALSCIRNRNIVVNICTPIFDVVYRSALCSTRRRFPPPSGWRSSR